MRILGVSALGHDAAVSVICDGQITFAAHAERYSRIKNDPHLNADLLADALRDGPPDVVCWYERPWRKKFRQIVAGQWQEVLTPRPRAHLAQFGLDQRPIRYYSHHYTHAAAGYFTSPFREACVVVVDSIGEFTTISVWNAIGKKLTPIWQQGYPHSLGVLYSAMTQRCGLKPNDEEYILMGMAGYGQPYYVDDIRSDFVAAARPPWFRLRRNVRRGIEGWRPDITNHFDLAASMQNITERYLIDLVSLANAWTGSDNLVLAGDVALNYLANTKVAQRCGFRHLWIMPNPGDAGSSLGAALAYRGRHVIWDTPYLGHNIDRALNLRGIIEALEAGQVVGVANGRAEFGPRALGNRSLLADPRGSEVRDKLNRVTQRKPFRPFAPAVVAYMADAHFMMPVERSPYMQFVAQCRTPEKYPAICHTDGTSRVQTVTRQDNANLHDLLCMWHWRTGCPMLINTSLKGEDEPLVNTWADAERFAQTHGVLVF